MSNQLWGFLIVEELIRCGCDRFILSPGSRSTPLTAAIAKNPRAQTTVAIDERGAAFMAVGYARATGKAAVLVCTSGSALSNYYPAIIEAATEFLPLIIISADRPPELRQTGANQTIDQPHIYSHNYLQWQFDLPCPTVEIPPQMVLTTIDTLVDRSISTQQGVVHLNCMFREPLAPSSLDVEIPPVLAKWQTSDRPYTSYGERMTIADVNTLVELEDIIAATERGILAIGQLKSPAEMDAVARLIEYLNWPVFVDIRSGLRSIDGLPQIIHYADRLLVHPEKFDLDKIDTIIQIGTRFVSSRYQKWLEKILPERYILIAEDSDRHDPSHLVTDRIQSDLSYLCKHLITSLTFPQPAKPYLADLISNNDKLDRQIDDVFAKTDTLTEPFICRQTIAITPSDRALWIANSMPVRDADMYAPKRANYLRIGTNRGTSGIEGAIASACGFALGLQAPVTAIIGDLSSLHDLNSLLLLKSIDFPLIIIVINNNGGGIFSFLPIAKSTDIFDRYFGTPHNLNLEHAAKMFGLNYHQPTTPAGFIASYQQAIDMCQHTIIEVTTDRQENYNFHQLLP